MHMINGPEFETELFACEQMAWQTFSLKRHLPGRNELNRAKRRVHMTHRHSILNVV